MDTAEGGSGINVLFTVLGLIVSVFVLIDFSVPFMNSYGSLIGLDGTVGRMDHGDIWSGLDGLSSAMYSAGDLMCHQEQVRTLMLNGNEMPLCIRDTFLFAGFAIGFILVGIRIPQLRKGSAGLFAIACIMVLLTLVEWSAEHFMSFDCPSLRAAVSLLSGTGASVALFCIYDAESRWLERKSAERAKK